MSTERTLSGRKRKVDAVAKDDEEIEVDLNAPEPPSKKALRKAKKSRQGSTRSSDSLGADAQENSGAGPVTNDGDSNSQELLIEESSSTSKPKPAKKKKDASEYGIWIGNLAFFSTKDDLMNFLTKPDTGLTQRDITRIHLPQGPPKNGSKVQNKGFAYIDFVSREAQQAAINLSEKLLGGRRVLIKGSKNFEGRPEKAESETVSKIPSSRRIFIGNLSFDVTTDDLREHFSRCGQIENVHMATFQDSGKCKGYAWITFEGLSSAEKAVRGWVDTSGSMQELADSNSDVGGTEAASTTSRVPTKRIQINKIFGRKLRMEFAEDPTTRYKKRFGKGPANQESLEETGDMLQPSVIVEDQENPPDGERGHSDLGRKSSKTKARDPKGPARVGHSRYGQSTVQRLTGAAVAGEGKKITFD